MNPERRGPPEAVEMVERAIFLLRSRPAGTWAVYAAGAAPLFLSALYFVFDAIAAGTNPSRIMVQALLCATCFLWFCVCRARFAQLLTSALSDRDGNGWKQSFDPRTLFVQSCRLFAFPLAALAIFPLAWAVSFFRSNAVFAGRNAFRRALKMAGVWQRQTWVLLLILTVFSLMVFVNIVALLAMLPLLVQIFSGTENEFTRLGVSLNRTVFAIGAGLAWLLLEPLYQSVFCVRAFLADSRESGLDLTYTLRRLSILALAALLLAPHAPAQTRPDVSAQELKASIEKVLEQREYAWRLPRPQEDRPAFLNAMAGMFAPVRNGAHRLGRWVVQLFRKLFGSSPSDTSDKPAPFPAIKWTAIVLIALLAVLAGFALLRLTRGRTAAVAQALAPLIASTQLEGENISASDLPEERWLELGRECLARGDYRLASRALYLANLSWLGRRQLLTIAPFKSNRDYCQELRRRAPGEELHRSFAENVRAFERGWYGRHAVDAERFQDFERNLSRMKDYAGA